MNNASRKLLIVFVTYQITHCLVISYYLFLSCDSLSSYQMSNNEGKSLHRIKLKTVIKTIQKNVPIKKTYDATSRKIRLWPTIK